MFTFANVLDFLMHVFASLCRSGFALALGTSGFGCSFLLRHERTLLLGKNGRGGGHAAGVAMSAIRPMWPSLTIVRLP